jgi:hypothetical protein
MRSESFDIVLSKTLAPDATAGAISNLIPSGLRVDVRTDIADLPDEPGAVWAVVYETNDPDWPCYLSVLVCADACELGAYPDLRIAEYFSRQFDVSSLCSTYPFAGDLDPQDPYWSLACIGGQWHLASTCGTRLMGPYTDGVREFPGSNQVRLVRSVSVPEFV